MAIRAYQMNEFGRLKVPGPRLQAISYFSNQAPSSALMNVGYLVMVGKSMAFTENILIRGYRLWPRLGLEAVVSVIPQSRTYPELSLLWPHI